jgi:ABC-2 type transport system permease protein
MSGFGVIYGIFQAAAYNSAAGATTASRAAFGQQMETFGRTFSTLLPIPVRVGTLSGYMQWRVYGALPMLFGFWAVLSATGATRGDEGHGLVEQWLCNGLSRTRYIAARFAVFAAAAIVAVAVTSAAIDIGAKVALDLLAVGELSLALLALTLALYAIATALSQLTTGRNAATGLAGGVVLAMFFINGFSRSDPNMVSVARVVSPFYYFERSNPLTPGGNFDLAATVGLAIVAVALFALTMWLMQARDIDSALLRWPARWRNGGPATHRLSHNPMLRIPALSSLYEHRWGLLAWAVSAGVLAAYLASIARSFVDLARQPGAFHRYLAFIGHGNAYVALAGFFWFGTFQTLLCVYAITRVASWSADDNEGRLEMELSAPVPRWRVVTERATAFAISSSAVIGVSSAAFYLGAAAANIPIPVGDLAVASAALLPFVLSFAAIGAVLVSQAPRATVPILMFVAFVSYLLTQLGPLLKLPDWALKLSVFSLYGSPLTSGIYGTGLGILVGIVLVGFASAGFALQGRDVGS